MRHNVFDSMPSNIVSGEEHHLDYIVLTTDNSMMKIGQYPSVADMMEAVRSIVLN